MSNLSLQNRIGHRLVSTIKVENHPWDYETIVFGGRNQDRIAHIETYQDEEKAKEGHETVVVDVEQNSSNFDLRVKPWYERFSVVSPN